MNPNARSSRIEGCILRSLDDRASRACLAWVRGEQPPPDEDAVADLRWALAHCDDGVVWARFDADAGLWRRASDVVPALVPRLRVETLQELRVFGPKHEVLVWRTSEGLCGRVVTDSSLLDASDAARPADEWRLLRGTTVKAALEHAFTHVVDATGAEQVLPMRVESQDLRRGCAVLGVRHYFEVDPHTGAVRVAVTRLVDLRSGGPDGG